jgi:hypothetical protein
MGRNVNYTNAPMGNEETISFELLYIDYITKQKLGFANT